MCIMAKNLYLACENLADYTILGNKYTIYYLIWFYHKAEYTILGSKYTIYYLIWFYHKVSVRQVFVCEV